MRITVLAAVAILAAAAACGEGPVAACDLLGQRSVVVHVRDAESDAFIAAGARLILTDGEFIDSITAPSAGEDPDARGLSTMGSIARAGLYDVTIRKDGYLDCHREDVLVWQWGCDVQKVTLTAYLVPAP